MVTVITQNKDGSYTKTVDGKAYIINKADSRYGRIGGEYATQQGYGNGAGGVDSSGTIYTLNNTSDGSTGGSKGGSRFGISAFRARMGQPMTMQQAYGQAGKELDPIYGQYRTNAGAVAQQQQALLKQQLAARGQLNGGLANQGSVDISADLLNTLSNLDAQKASQLASRAADLQNTSFNQNSQTFNNNLNAWNTTNSLGLQQQQLNDANSQYQQNFGYQQGRDAVADEQWRKTFEENQRQYGLDYALQKLQADRSWQLSNQRASFGGSSGSGGDTAQDTGWSDEEILKMAISAAQKDARVSGSAGVKQANINDVIQEYVDYYSQEKYNNNLASTEAYLDAMNPTQAAQLMSQNKDNIISEIGENNYYKLYGKYAFAR